MRFLFVITFLLSSSIVYCGDTIPQVYPEPVLKGYSKLFYKIIQLHPKLNSPLEKLLLKYYLAGSGKPFKFSTADFLLLKNAVSAKGETSCEPLKGNETVYCTRQVNLIDDVYFGWGLGTITCIFQTSDRQLISFVDVYDFNKKKTGKRKANLELLTRFFHAIAPKSTKPFLVTYAKDAFYSN